PPGMRPIIAGHHAGRHADRAEGCGACPDDGQVSVPQKVLAPMAHDVDKAWWLHAQEPITIGGITGNTLPEKLRLADRRHAALLRHLNELALIVVRQALRREGPACHPPQAEPPDRLWMTQ